MAPKPPPEAIEELPPDQRPDGNNVAWIPGYFAWDDERNDFLWVSGIWRDLPPGREWVSGYWGNPAKVRSGPPATGRMRDVSEVEYLTEPPQSIEEGPSVAATDPDQTWLPGSWVWQQNRYAWRPGFWATVQPNWVWVPDHYRWAPRGYVYVDGYWDYSSTVAAYFFAPAYFNANLYSRPGFSYSPSMVINLNAFTDHLFVRSGYGHYYFGDYYASNYGTSGFYPWFSFQQHRATIRFMRMTAGGIATTVVGNNASQPTSGAGGTMKGAGRRAHGQFKCAKQTGEVHRGGPRVSRSLTTNSQRAKTTNAGSRRSTKTNVNRSASAIKTCATYRDERQKREIKPAEADVEKTPAKASPNKVKRDPISDHGEARQSVLQGASASAETADSQSRSQGRATTQKAGEQYRNFAGRAEGGDAAGGTRSPQRQPDGDQAQH